MKKTMKSTYQFTLFIVIIISVISCSDKQVYNVAVSPNKKMAEYRRLDKIFKKYSEKNGSKFQLKLKDSIDFQFSTNINLLLDNNSKYDMTIINNMSYTSKDSSSSDYDKVKVILPISSRILYIAYNKQKISTDNISELFKNRSVVILSYEIDFIKSVLTDLGVNISKTKFLKTKYNAEEKAFKKLEKSIQDSILKIDYYKEYTKETPLPYDIEIGFITHNSFTKSRLYDFLNFRSEEFSLFSLDDYQMYRNGSFVEGFCLRNKYFTPYLLPKGTYGVFPEKPVLTLRQDFNLVAKENVDEEFIYEFVKTSLEETDLIDLNLYGKSFENINFSFGLHEGTKRYFDKNAPTFYEKYGELIGKIGTGVGGFYTVVVALLIWRKSRKRKIINADYQKILKIQSNINSANNIDELKEMYDNIQEIQNIYHNMLIEHKVLIDESFKIFIDTMNKNEKYLIDKITSLQKKSI
jgi:hypothetical protein